MVELVTGTAGKDHVSSADVGSFNAGIIGEGTYILPRGKRMQCEKVSDNLVKVLDGDMLFKGRHIRIEPEDYEELTIVNGASGTKRHDLICIRIEKNENTQIETASFVVVQGEFADNPVDPQYTEGTILEGDYTVDEYPICRVVLNGLQIESVTMLVEEVKAISELQEEVARKANEEDVNASVKALEKSINNLSSSKADTSSVNNAFSSVNSAISDLETSKAEQTELEALSNRVGNLTSLGEDATEGNLELLDIRVGVDGTVHKSAGEAVRTQIKNVEGQIDAHTVTTTETTLANSKASALKVNAIRGNSVQNGTPTVVVPIAVESVGDGGSITVTASDGADNTTSFTISLDKPLRKVGDVSDVAMIKDGVLGALRNIIVVNSADMVQGNFGDSAQTNPNGKVFTYINNNVEPTGALWTTRAKGSKVASIGLNEFCIVKSSSGNTVIYLILNETTVAAAKTALIAEASELYLIAKEPVFEPFSDEVQALFYQLESYDGVTYIITDSEVQPTIEVEYAVTDAGAHMLNNYAKSNLAELKAQDALPSNSTTRSTAVTVEGLKSVDAVELNPSVEGTLANKIEKANYELTYDIAVHSNSTDYVTITVQNAYKVGRVATITIKFMLSGGGGGMSLFTLPEALKPIGQIYGTLYVASDIPALIYAISTNGLIFLDGVPAKGTYVMTATYLCAE